MLSLPASVRVFVYTEPTDMRRGFDGLAAMVEQALNQDPFSGHLFVFFNRRRDRTRILFWDRDGFALFCKRLEKGVFEILRPQGSISSEEQLPSVQVTYQELAMLLDGVDLSTVRRRPRYARPAGAQSSM
jgi:hypothetical protein